jgi:hypothetical protein
MICVLFGGNMAYILRTTSQHVEVDGLTYQCFLFIGNAYIHGFMQGEAIHMMSGGELERTKFHLV